MPAKKKRSPQPLPQETELDVEAILERIRGARNFDFRNYKRATLRRRIERRMADRKCKTVGEYQQLLDREPGEFDALIGTLLIKLTSFFRDPESWDALTRKIIPQILSQKRPGEEIRVWCPGCATGEEAFTVAMLFAEAMGPQFHNTEIKVFGTDVDDRAISYARHAVYTREQVSGVPKKVLARWFTEEQGGLSVRKEIRRAVVFGVNNLVSDAPISRLDLLICRNVFIYLDAPLQKRILTRFHYALRRHGIVMLGKSELIPFAAKLFEPVDLSRRIYKKDGKRESLAGQERLLALLDQDTIRRSADESRSELALAEQFHREVFQSESVPVVATSLDGTILAWNSCAALLWGRSETEVLGKKLASLNLAGLSGELLVERSAQVREGRSQLESGAGVLTRHSDKHHLQIRVDVTPLRNADREPSGLVYLVHDATTLHETESELRKAVTERQNALEELQTINEEMQSSNEELETTNEELQSANEELQTTNEELQSTNEELETTNEELQSTNAELDATNRELAARTEEMNALSYFQRTIIRTLASAVVVLDQDGKVKLWNLAAERLLGLTEEEASGQVLWTLHVPGLARASLARVRKAVSQNQSLRAEAVDYELANGSTGKALLSAVPISDDGHVLGSVVIFEDTTRLQALVSEVAELKADGGRGKGS